MASVVQICNIALSRVGQSQRIDSLGEQSAAAEQCTLHYELCRDEVLRDFPWPFAEARVVLADIGSPPTNWCYRYRYPTDCIQARYLVVSGTEQPRSDQRIPFKVVHADGGRAIVTNQEAAELVYTKRVEDTTYFDPLFTSALAWRLAGELAMGLVVNPDLYTAAIQNYQILINQAKAIAFEESEQGPALESEYITARN